MRGLMAVVGVLLTLHGVSLRASELEGEPLPDASMGGAEAGADDSTGKGPDVSSPLKELTLEQAFDLAAQNHPDQSFWRAKFEGAGARVDQAGKMPNPEFSARMESVPLHRGGVGDSDVLAGVSQEIPTAGKLAKARRVAQANRTRIEFEQSAGWLEIRKKVHAAFAAALYNERLCSLQSEALKASEQNLEIAKSKVKAGEAVSDEVARAEMECARTRLDLERAKSLRKQARSELVVAMGQPEMAVESVSGQIEATLEVPAIEELASDLAKHPRLLAAEAETAAQRARVDLAQAQRIPNVNVDLLYRRVGSERLNALDAGFSISIPLFDGGKARVREAEAERRAAEAKSRSERIALEGELRSAHLQLVRALQSSKLIVEEIVPRSQSLLKTAEARYKAGDTSLENILPIRRDATASQLSHLEALREVMAAWVQLKPFVNRR